MYLGVNCRDMVPQRSALQRTDTAEAVMGGGDTGAVDAVDDEW